MTTRRAAIVIAIGGALILLSFLVLPWEKTNSVEFATGDPYTYELRGYEFGSIYQDDGETGEIFVGVTIAATVLMIVLGLVGLMPTMARRAMAFAVPAGLIAFGWLVYSVIWLRDSDMVDGETGIGVTIAWIAAVAVIAAAIAAVVVSRRARPTPSVNA